MKHIEVQTAIKVLSHFSVIVIDCEIRLKASKEQLIKDLFLKKKILLKRISSAATPRIGK